MVVFSFKKAELGFKVAQNSFQRLDFDGSLHPLFYHMMLQSWCHKNCPVVGGHVVIIFLSQ